MSDRAERGTKRVCQNCRSKFYDLARSPIVCPVCGTTFELRAAPAPRSAFSAKPAAPIDDDEKVTAPVEGVEFVPLDDLERAEGDDLPDLDAEDVADIGDDAADIDAGDDEETFLEDEDEGDADVNGFVGGARDSDEDI